jgi:quinol-cytochrome oxidoreductase complex cytochrome b subunit
MASLVAVVILVVTGILLTLYYEPDPGEAHRSVLYITNAVPFGWLIRGLHHWAANALIVLAIAHLVRVVLHGAYKFPRQVTWITGIVLLVLVFAYVVTGRLLPWDQQAFWATQARMEILASVPGLGAWLARFLQDGDQLSGSSLSRFYTLHVWVLPLALAGLIVSHLRLVIRHGVSALPGDAPDSGESDSRS